MEMYGLALRRDRMIATAQALASALRILACSISLLPNKYTWTRSSSVRAMIFGLRFPNQRRHSIIFVLRYCVRHQTGMSLRGAAAAMILRRPTHPICPAAGIQQSIKRKYFRSAFLQLSRLGASVPAFPGPQFVVFCAAGRSSSYPQSQHRIQGWSMRPISPIILAHFPSDVFLGAVLAIPHSLPGIAPPLNGTIRLGFYP